MRPDARTLGSKPHVRGDEPKILADYLDTGSVSPTCVGMNPSREIHRLVSRSKPHVRGDEPCPTGDYTAISR